MLTSLMSAELAASRHADFIAAADAARRARLARRASARRTERHNATARRPWLRAATTQPTHI